MSVVKSKRKISQFEVFHHLYQLRRDITELLLRDFGYSTEKEQIRIMKRMGIQQDKPMSDEDKMRYNFCAQRWNAFDRWFILDERKTIVDCLRNITEHVFVANSIYPTCPEELAQRRIHQDEAVGQCYRLAQELQYAMETLPVDMNKYTRFGESIETQVKLIKGWRKSDNKFKKGFS